MLKIRNREQDLELILDYLSLCFIILQRYPNLQIYPLIEQAIKEVENDFNSSTRH